MKAQTDKQLYQKGYGMTSKQRRQKVAMTPAQVREKLRLEGRTIKQWSLDNGHDVNRVYRVLAGLEKCLYGKSHQIAVELGLKVVPEPETEADK